MNATIQPLDVPVAYNCDTFFAPSTPKLRTWHVVRAAHADEGPCGDRAFVEPLGSGRAALVVIDVAGHGAARAPLSSIIAGHIKASIRDDASPAEALMCADERLRAFGGDDDTLPYAVVFVGIVHAELRTVAYASAGHDVAFAVNRDGRTRNLAATAPMLGIPLAVRPFNAMFALESNEALVIATDGVAESRPPGSRDFFGAVGSARAVTRSLRQNRDPARAVLDAACAHGAGHQADDIGVIVARVSDPVVARKQTCIRCGGL